LVLGIPSVTLINDFVAIGYGLLTLNEDEYITMQEGEHEPGGPIACIGAGTGLGECYMTTHDGAPHAWPSEGGHAEWAPRNELEYELNVSIHPILRSDITLPASHI
jgi:glucokinase